MVSYVEYVMKINSFCIYGFRNNIDFLEKNKAICYFINCYVEKKCQEEA